ncbi:hypothetical protein B296_00011672 [Ensete ventricosum]|uniref:Uncharacterized protein n=1 Tax=Ensete ventricosum TaxID=4639 RepID=A0A427A9L0_ENSVE|nr:hypothetical protein B296_00011672 [Ensete ventricosum]
MTETDNPNTTTNLRQAKKRLNRSKRALLTGYAVNWKSCRLQIASFRLCITECPTYKKEKCVMLHELEVERSSSAARRNWGHFEVPQKIDHRHKLSPLSGCTLGMFLLDAVNDEELRFPR